MDIPLWVSILVYVSALAILLGVGLWVGFALAGAGIIGFLFLCDGGLGQVPAIMFNSVNSFVLTAVPLFIFAGEIMLRSRMSDDLYRGVSKWLTIFPGGLLHSNIGACAVFAALSGSSNATAATIGSVAIPEQKPRGYDTRMIFGSLAAGGTLGILIPPSIVMIVYGAFVGVPVGRLFIGGIIPGIILATLFIVYIAMVCRFRPQLAPPREKITRSYFPRALTAFKDMGPILLVITIIIGSIYAGIATPTEAAAVSGMLVLIMAGLRRRLSFSLIWQSASRALTTTSMILFIMLGALIFSTSMAMIKIPARIIELMLSFDFNIYIYLAMLVVLYIALGCLLEGMSLMLLTLPVTFPLVVDGLGCDPIWFGVFITLMLEIGMITPPVGLNLFVIHGISEGTSMRQVIVGALPFVVIMLIALTLFIAFPSLVTWLPSTMFEAMY